MPEKQAAEGRIVTFYSYKGGTGRSMAMANVSWLLALSGYKVLVIDWDLEAPGLHRYFRPFLADPDLAESDGLIDFVIHFAEAASEQTAEQTDPEWYKTYSNLLPYAKELDYEFPGEGTLDFIPAGRQNGSYAVRVNSFNWKHFYEKLNGGQVLEEARRVLKAEYDYVLIDSRTGVSDTAGICTVELPDDLVVCFTLNLQSVIGASAVAASVVEQRQQRGKSIRVFPIPMRVEPNEKLKTATMKAYAKPRFATLLPAEMTDEQKDKYWAESDVPYIPFYAFEENLAYFRDEPNSLNSVLFAMTRIASRLAPKEIVDLPRLDQEVQAKTVAAYDAFSGTAAAVESQKPRTAVYLSVVSIVDTASVLLRRQLESAGYDLLTRERFEKVSAATFLLAIGPEGLTPGQSTELALAELRSGPIYTVLLPGVQVENLPRLLLPYGVIDLRSGGTLVLPGPSDGEKLERLPLAPYPGLNPFSAFDGPVFVARGRLTAELVDAVMKAPFVALIGPLHSGKTSIVQAGLIPRLSTMVPPIPVWDESFAWPSGTSIFARPTQTTRSTRMLVIVNAKALADSGVAALPENTCVLAIAETSDQIALCEQAVRMTAVRIEVPPLSEPELMAAITEPALRAGLSVGPGLAERIVADLKDEHAKLPLLQYVMSELYSGEPRGTLSIEKYERMGGMGMVELKCEKAFSGSGLSSLSRLVSVSEAGRISPQDALEASFRSEDRAVLAAFVSAGVVARDGPIVRFSNSIFLDRWQRLRQWAEQNRDFLLWRQRLNQNQAAWQTNPRPYALLHGEALVEAQRQVAKRSEDLNEQERAYIEASAKNAEADRIQLAASQKQRRSRYFWISGLLLFFLVVAVYLYRSLSHQPSAPEPDSANVKTYPSGWCFQEAASAATRNRGLLSGYGVYCFESQQSCQTLAAQSLAAQQCQLVQKLDVRAWGGSIPGINGALLYRQNIPEPLPAPFPQPPAAKEQTQVKDQGFPSQGWCYQETASPATRKLKDGLKSGYGAYCHDLQQTCETTAAGSRTASRCVLIQNLNLQTWGGERPSAKGYPATSWYRIDMPHWLPTPFPKPPGAE